MNRRDPYLPDGARSANRRRLAIVAAAVAFALFVITMFVLTTTVYSGAENCGSPFGQTDASEACRDRIAGRWRLAFLLGVTSVALASLSFHWRWGRDWTSVRVIDAHEKMGS